MIKIIKIQKPDKKLVGQRIREVKKNLDLSFKELGDCLDLKKTTISSYVQGYNLPPLKVIEELSTMSGKSINWFYYGMEIPEKEGVKKMKEALVKREQVASAYFDFVTKEIKKMEESKSELSPLELAKYVEVCHLFRN